MKTIISLVCGNCGIVFEKDFSYYKKLAKKGRTVFFCDLKCSGEYFGNQRSDINGKKKQRVINIYCGVCGNEIKNNYRNRTRCGSCVVKIRRIKQKSKAIEYLGGGCSKCGYSRSYSALEFHHIDPKEKEFSIGKVIDKN